MSVKKHGDPGIVRKIYTNERETIRLSNFPGRASFKNRIRQEFNLSPNLFYTDVRKSLVMLSDKVKMELQYTAKKQSF